MRIWRRVTVDALSATMTEESVTTTERPSAVPGRLAGHRRLLGIAAVLLVPVIAAVVLVVARSSAPPMVPEQFRSLIRTSAAGCPGLDARVLAAQIEQDSGWDAQATSRAGAQGIAQFMPSVWRAYAVDGDGDGVKDVWNPRDAIPSAAARQLA